MPFNFNISKIRARVNQESVYVLMLSLIFLVNAWIICAQKIPGMQESFVGQKLFGSYLAKEEPLESKSDILKINEQELWNKLTEEERKLPPVLNIFGLLIIVGLSLGVYLDVRILVAHCKKTKVIRLARTHDKVKWGLGDILRLVIIFVFLGYIIHILQSIVLALLSSERIPQFIPLLNTGLIDLVFLGFIIYFVRIKYGQKLTALGLTLKNFGRNITLAVCAYLAFLPILIVMLLFLAVLSNIFNYQPDEHLLFRLFFEEQRLWILLCSTLVVAFLGPVAEEVFFRGFVYGAAKKKWGMFSAMLVTSLIFGALHANVIGFLPISALGFLLVYMYEKTGSLVPAITIHILHNGLMVSFLFLGRYLVKFAQ